MKKQLIIFQKLLSAICLAFVVCKTNVSYFRKPNWEKSLTEVQNAKAVQSGTLTDRINMFYDEIYY